MNGTTIIHLHFNGSGSDEYFGSISAIYDEYDANVIGVSYSRLRHILTPATPNINGIVTIKKGTITRKKTNRKNPLK